MIGSKLFAKLTRSKKKSPPERKCMGESFQDYSRNQDFEADFPQKVSLKILNSADNNSFSDLVSVYLKVFDH